MKKGSESSKETNYSRGINAEELAAKHLQEQGFEILETRYKTKFGEVDLICKRNNLLVFVEVKQRKNFGFDDPISKQQKKRIVNAALQYTQEKPDILDCDMRFDCIFINDDNIINYIQDSWRLED
jgi:putative endonuclease